MIKKIVTFLIAIAILPTVYGQISTDTLFTITYRPSFHNPSQLSVYKDKDGSKGLFQTIAIINGKVKIDTATATLSNETYTAYSKFDVRPGSSPMGLVSCRSDPGITFE